MHLFSKKTSLPRTPSLDYLPLTKDDKKVEKYYQGLIKHRSKTGQPHADLPMQPAGKRLMTDEEAAATRIFKAQHARVPDADSREYQQTYRREGDEMVANQDGLIPGGPNFVEHQPGMYPPGSRIDIHSHPDIVQPKNAVPSDLDYKTANQLRTNALHRPGTDLSGAILYYPPKDVFYGYSGERTGPNRTPEFHELVDPFPKSTAPHVGQDPPLRLRISDVTSPPRPPSPSGSYPPGTRIQIHSHPVTDEGFNAVPSLSDFHVAHRNRTNDVHYPGTRMENELMFDPNTRDFYAYSGKIEGPNYKPEYFRLEPPASGWGNPASDKPLPQVPMDSPAASSSGHASDGHG